MRESPSEKRLDDSWKAWFSNFLDFLPEVRSSNSEPRKSKNTRSSSWHPCLKTVLTPNDISRIRRVDEFFPNGPGFYLPGAFPRGVDCALEVLLQKVCLLGVVCVVQWFFFVDCIPQSRFTLAWKKIKDGWKNDPILSFRVKRSIFQWLSPFGCASCCEDLRLCQPSSRPCPCSPLLCWGARKVEGNPSWYMKVS